MLLHFYDKQIEKTNANFSGENAFKYLFVEYEQNISYELNNHNKIKIHFPK